MNQQPTAFRIERINELIKRELVLLFAHKISDTRLKSIRILEVDTSKDLSISKVFFNTDEGTDKIKKSLKKAEGFLRHHIAKSVQLRHTPELKFIYDSTQKTANRIDELLANL